MRETEALIKKAERFLESAELLCNDGDYESSISRTYYAMFYVAEAALLKKGLSYSSHRGVLSAFGENFIKSGGVPKDFGRELNRAFEKRQLSDYEPGFVITEGEARDMYKMGKEFVKRVVELINKIDEPQKP